MVRSHFLGLEWIAFSLVHQTSQLRMRTRRDTSRMLETCSSQAEHTEQSQMPSRNKWPPRVTREWSTFEEVWLLMMVLSHPSLKRSVIRGLDAFETLSTIRAKTCSRERQRKNIKQGSSSTVWDMWETEMRDMTWLWPRTASACCTKSFLVGLCFGALRRLQYYGEKSSQIVHNDLPTVVLLIMNSFWEKSYPCPCPYSSDDEETSQRKQVCHNTRTDEGLADISV